MSLRESNKHVRDEKLFFDEAPHKYYIEGVQTKTSVTTMVHHFFPHFDAKRIAPMTQRKNYNNSKSQYYQKSVDEIIDMWEENRNSAALAGTKLHKSIENFYNNEDPQNDSIEYEYFLNFHRDFNDLVPYRTEWEIYHEDHNIAGSVDMLFENPDGTLQIYDWKRSKEISHVNGYDKGTGPVSHMDHCNYNHYSLQLNIYKFILEQKYDKKITTMALVVCHPDNKNSNYLRYEVPDMQDVVKKIFNFYSTV
jgi:ATP-dependent exoDNAse (exonuclease V) beta subunit